MKAYKVGGVVDGELMGCSWYAVLCGVNVVR